MSRTLQEKTIFKQCRVLALFSSDPGNGKAYLLWKLAWVIVWIVEETPTFQTGGPPGLAQPHTQLLKIKTPVLVQKFNVRGGLRENFSVPQKLALEF
jgi:hypothetical protein